MKYVILKDDQEIYVPALHLERVEEGFKLSRDYNDIIISSMEVDAVIFMLEDLKHAEVPKEAKTEAATTPNINEDDDIPF